MLSSISDDSSDPEHLFLQAERFEEQGYLKRAFLFLLKAARMGHSSSQIQLGNFYSSGSGVRKSLKSAAYWYKQAYKGGVNTGALNLAVHKRDAGDTRGAIRWFIKAVAMNDGDACIQLAKMYMVRRGGNQKAVDLLTRTQTMNRTDISDESKEEAAELLAKLRIEVNRGRPLAAPTQLQLLSDSKKSGRK